MIQQILEPELQSSNVTKEVAPIASDLSSGSAVVETEGLSKSYGPIRAVKSLDLKVRKNSIFAFLGPNGAGKSTTIKMLLGLTKPTGGSTKVFGLDVAEESVDIRCRVGYLAQDPRFYAGMTARQTLEFVALEMLKSALIWIGLINGIMLMAMLAERSGGAQTLRLQAFGTELYTQLTAMFVAIGVTIVALDAIIGERDLGTAAFILSKPLSRASFILVKFVSNAVGILVTAVLIPGAIAYVQIWTIAGSKLSLVRFPIAMMILFIGLMFYLALTLLLGVLFRHKSPVIGIPLALLFGHRLLVSEVPEILYVTPWGFTELTKAYIMEGSLSPTLPLFAVPVTVALMLAVSIAVFEREDL